MLRNKEARRFAAVFGGMAALFAAVGFWLSPAAGWLALAAALAFGAAFWLFTRGRYRQIAALCEQIDQTLHSARQLCFAQMEEGELAILSSEIAKMTVRIQEQNEALIREKGRLADSLADVAHQLRTPLTSVNLILSLLENAAESDRRQALAREAQALLEQMDWLLTALLKLSRLDAGVVAFQTEAVAVGDLLAAASRPLLIPMELRDIRLTLDAPQGAVITGDRRWLSEAVQNILKNGMESAGEHGWLTVTCTDNPLYTQLAIRDSGPGFSKEALPNVFNRFYRGQSTQKAGYGIGLALCKTIVTRMDGTITAQNHPDGGAVFTLRFPKVTDLSPKSHGAVS